MSSTPRIAMIVPARDEARVIERKLHNLAWLDWPPPERGPHVLCVVDDGSSDDTAERARAMDEVFPQEVGLRVLTNEGPPGKAAAIHTALEVLSDGRGGEDPFELVVLSDADVMLEQDALVQLVGAFIQEPNLGVACGAQVFVHSLGLGPSPSGAVPGTALVPAAELYDRATALVRRFESQLGRLFSVHGQLCAWRVGRGYEPPPGMAADDLEIGFRARARGQTVRMVPEACFFEEKASGGDGHAQAERRARAYFQVMRGRSWPLGRGFWDRAQWLLYRGVPPLAPYVLLVAALVVPSLGFAFAGISGLVVTGTLVLVLLASRPGRTLVRRMWVIAKAQHGALELSDRWDTLRSRTSVSEGT